MAGKVAEFYIKSLLTIFAYVFTPLIGMGFIASLFQALPINEPVNQKILNNHDSFNAEEKELLIKEIF